MYGDRNITHDLKLGSTYLFKNVKVKLNEFGKIKGRLNYADLNIVKVTIRTEDNANKLALNALEE